MTIKRESNKMTTKKVFDLRLDDVIQIEDCEYRITNIRQDRNPQGFTLFTLSGVDINDRFDRFTIGPVVGFAKLDVTMSLCPECQVSLAILPNKVCEAC